jgi:hypothetical protein
VVFFFLFEHDACDSAYFPLNCRTAGWGSEIECGLFTCMELKIDAAFPIVFTYSSPAACSM